MSSTTYVQHNVNKHTRKLKKIWLFSGKLFSSNISYRPKYHHGSQETGCTEILYFLERLVKTCRLSAGRRGQSPHPLSVQLFHKPGTLSGLAGRRDPLCSSSGSSLNSEDHETSRSPPCRRPLFWGECIARWTAAPLC